MNVFETLLVLLNVAHHTNDPGSPRPGATTAQIKLNFRSSLPLCDADFAHAHIGVPRYVKDYTMPATSLHMTPSPLSASPSSSI